MRLCACNLERQNNIKLLCAILSKRHGWSTFIHTHSWMCTHERRLIAVNSVKKYHSINSRNTIKSFQNRKPSNQHREIRVACTFCRPAPHKRNRERERGGEKGHRLGAATEVFGVMSIDLLSLHGREERNVLDRPQERLVCKSRWPITILYHHQLAAVENEDTSTQRGVSH